MTMKKLLVACEFSGTVREAFAKNNAMLDGVQRGLEEYLQTS